MNGAFACSPLEQHEQVNTFCPRRFSCAATMSRIIIVTLLLLVLSDFCHNTVSGDQASLTRGYFRKCGCKVHRNRILCDAKNETRKRCLCSQATSDTFPKFHKFCRSLHQSPPLSLL
ncbi:uncharacterized protein LOC129603275 isoform X1 [Betta splendens]|uniref:Uncharacterized protein LOC129603275 isoform X1 n=1 Tax=Betta splendens TaxID=158456 RepID=A0A9W2XD77_BETSP|nr:uncharacterized protein LOC129603275 isoform X1 [Betta splendens]